METPEQFFTRVWVRLNSQWTSILTFRQLGRSGLPLATREALRSNFEFAEQLASSPEYEKLFTDRKKLLESGILKELPARMTRNAVEIFEATLDAASLVFAHSALDAAAYDYCRLCAMVAPRDLLPFVAEKKLALTEVELRPFDKLLEGINKAFLSNLEKESMMRKIDFVFQLCKPPAGFAPMDGYSFSRPRLRRLDELRHKVVHSTGPASRLPDSDADLEFLLKTGYFLMGVVNERYGVKMDPTHVAALYANQRK
jgi:hypothetical protein